MRINEEDNNISNIGRQTDTQKQTHRQTDIQRRKQCTHWMQLVRICKSLLHLQLNRSSHLVTWGVGAKSTWSEYTRGIHPTIHRAMSEGAPGPFISHSNYPEAHVKRAYTSSAVFIT